MVSLLHALQLKVTMSVDDSIDISIAKYLLENINNSEMKNITVEKLALECFTSPASVSRFIKSIGFSNFNNFRENYINYKSDRALKISKMNQESFYFNNEPPETTLKNYVSLIHDSLSNFQEHIDFTRIDALCKRIYESRYIYLFGTHLPGMFLEYMQFQFMNIGKYMEYYNNKQDQIKAIRMIPEDSLVIVYSGNGNFLESIQQSVLELTMNDAIFSILVTQMPSSKFALLFSEVISLGEDGSEKGSRYKFQLFSELLVNRYIYLYGNR